MSRQRLFADSRFTVVHVVTSSATPAHSHSEYVVSHYLSGRSRCLIPSIGLVEFQRGETALLNPEEMHQDYESRRARDYLMVSITKEVFQSLVTSMGLAREVPFFPAPKLEPSRPVSRIFESLIPEVDNLWCGREVVLRSLVNELAVHLVRRFTLSAKQSYRYGSEQTKARYQARKAIQYLDDTFNQPFNLDKLAAASELSKFHLSRVFKRATGLTPHTYAQMLRVEKAKRLLTSTKIPIAEIADHLGFSHQSHLTNVFKKLTGTTPNAYRLASK